MATIDDTRISTAALAAWLGVPVETLKNLIYRGDERLTADRDGRNLAWSFAACLTAFVAVEAMRRGRSANMAVKIAHEVDAFRQFMAGRPVSLSAIAPVDSEVAPLSLEEPGMELARFFAHHLAATPDGTGGYRGSRAYDEAMRHLHKHIARVRGHK